jgi:transcriptional regulator with XRE-family HTH domain
VVRRPPPRWTHAREPRHGLEQHGYDVIGARIKAIRTRIGLTQRQLEHLTGIDQTVLSRLENGRQYGLRWARYAILIGVLDDLDPAGPRFSEPWWVTMGIAPPDHMIDRLRAQGYDVPDAAPTQRSSAADHEVDALD